MAVTQGHGNPNWTVDEVILALELYFSFGGIIPKASDERVQALSQLLKSFPYHALAARKASFRNPEAVVFKLQNIRQVATGKGLGNVSRIDRLVWAEFGNNPAATALRAGLIRSALADFASTADYEVETGQSFDEGLTVTYAHIRHERAPRLRSLLLAERRKIGGLRCDLCSYRYIGPLEYSDRVFEAHHLIPLAAGVQRKTRVQDLALLCANCHRLMHSAIAHNKKWLTIREASLLIYGNEPA